MGTVRTGAFLAYRMEFGFYSMCNEKLLERFKQRSNLHFLNNHSGFCMEIRL